MHEGIDGGLKKLRSNRDKSSGPVEAGSGIWKDWSKSNNVGTMEEVSESDTACERPPSIPLGRLGLEESESLSDKRLFLGRGGGTSSHVRGATVWDCDSRHFGDSWVLEFWNGFSVM